MTSFYSSEEVKCLGFEHIGENVLVSKKASIYASNMISIGDNVRIDDFCILSGKIHIGSHIHISAYTGLFGGKSGICLEDFVTISSRCVLYADSDDYSGEFLTNPMIPDKYTNVTGGLVYLGEHAILGTNCTVLPNVRINEGVAVGAMSLVIRDLEAWKMYVGIPCKYLKERSRRLLSQKEEYLINN